MLQKARIQEIGFLIRVNKSDSGKRYGIAQFKLDDRAHCTHM